VHLKTAEAPGKAGDQLGISWEYHRNTNNNYIDILNMGCRYAK
jgi:hypothetical protein